MKLGKRITKIIGKPSDFFKYIKNEKSWKNTLSYYFIVNIIILGLWTYISMILYSVIRSEDAVILPILRTTGYIFIYIIIFILFAFVFHTVNKLFGGKGNFHDSFKILSYGQTPTSIFAIIPIIGFLAELYSIHLILVGQEEIHNLSSARRIISLLLTLIIMTILMFTIFFLFFSIIIYPHIRNMVGV